ncbi:MAG: hypothetical protein AAF961_05100 [Planctomycetota bacterium]
MAAVLRLYGGTAATLAALLLCPGCGGGAPPPEGQLAIESVAKWYMYYRADNRGRPPESEEEFMAFVVKKLQERGREVDTSELLISPRDGKKYVVQYGEPNSRIPDQNVAVCESEGYEGMKLVGFEGGGSKEVNESELQSLLAGD